MLGIVRASRFRRGTMRGTAARQAMMLTAVTPDALVPHRHPIRQIKPIVDAALAQMSPTFERMYAQDGRPSISDRKSNREPNERKAPARCSGVVTDQHEGERVAVAAVTRAVAGRCGENAADKGADSGWMRLDEDCGGRGRALLALRGTAMRSKRFDSAPSTRSVQGGRIESRRRTTSYSSSFRPAFTRWFRIFLICTGFWITAITRNRAPQRGQTSGSTS